MGEAYLHNHGGLSYSLSATFSPHNNVFIVGQPANDGRAIITAALGNTQVTLDPDECTFSPATIAANTTAITITKKIGSAPRSVSLPITAVSLSSIFGENTWDAIAAAAYSGVHADFWNAGDEKTEYISGVQYTFRILGFDHNVLASDDEMYSSYYNKRSGKAAIALQFKESLGRSGIHNNTQNIAGWSTTTMRLETLPALFSQFPTVMKNAVRLVNVWASHGEGVNVHTMYNSPDKLTLISIWEAQEQPWANYNRIYPESTLCKCYKLFENGYIGLSYSRDEWTRSSCVYANHDPKEFYSIGSSDEPFHNNYITAMSPTTNMQYRPIFNI